MNLQLVSPYKKCPYNCPFCVAATDNDYPWKDNLYETDKERYFKNLINTIKEQNIKTVVITGDTEPTLFPEWLDDCLIALRKEFPEDIEIELQTKNYKFNTKIGRGLENSDYSALDVVAFSIANKLDLERVKRRKEKDSYFQASEITRLTMLLNKNLNVNDITLITKKFYNNDDDFKGVAQLTLKTLQPSAMGIKKIDTWINNNIVTLPKAKKDMLKLSLMIDDNCMNAEGRYIIFRIDGKVYKDWAELPA